jgi:cell division protein FtsN
VGRTLGQAITNQGVQIKAQEQPAAGTNPPPEQSGAPPTQPRVELEPREPTEAEKQDLTQQKLDQSAQSGESASAESSPPAAESPAAPEKPAETAAPAAGYQVTAGSFTVAANAERVKRSLEKQGYHPYLTEVQGRGATYHRVVVGAYGSREEAEAVKKDLEAAGFVAGVSGP